MTDLDAYTDEELERALAHVLAHARGEVLSDAEVQKFWQLNEEILRRRVPSGTAAQRDELLTDAIRRAVEKLLPAKFAEIRLRQDAA